MFDFLIDIVPRQAPAPVPVSTGKSTEGTKKNGSRKRKAEKEVSEEEEEEEEENGDEEGEEEEGDEGEPEVSFLFRCDGGRRTDSDLVWVGPLRNGNGPR